MSSWIIHTTVTSAICFALEKRPMTENAPVTTDSWTPSPQIDINAIQQTSWSESVPLEHITHAPKVVVETRPATQVVRDDAPSSMMVVACLLGVAVFSLILCVMTLPHHWFNGNTTRWR
jgi:hypothetical protein